MWTWLSSLPLLRAVHLKGPSRCCEEQGWIRVGSLQAAKVLPSSPPCWQGRFSVEQGRGATGGRLHPHSQNKAWPLGLPLCQGRGTLVHPGNQSTHVYFLVWKSHQEGCDLVAKPLFSQIRILLKVPPRQPVTISPIATLAQPTS